MMQWSVHFIDDTPPDIVEAGYFECQGSWLIFRSDPLAGTRGTVAVYSSTFAIRVVPSR